MSECVHDWEPGTQGRVFRCKACGATAIRFTTAKSPEKKWYQTLWFFLGAGAIGAALVYLLAR